MLSIRPFRALRPTAQDAPAIAALPYDVQDVVESRRIVAANPRSFLAIDEPVVNFPEGTDQYSPEVYRKAGALLRGLKEQGAMASDERESYYLYELTAGAHVQNGLVCCVSIDDYLGDIVKKHESTRVVKRVDRTNHIDACAAQTGPIMLVYRSDEALERIATTAKANRPLFDFVAENGVRHRGFAIDEALNADVTEAAKAIERAYIADGHHRAAAAAQVAQNRRAARAGSEGERESDWLLAVLFPDSETLIYSYNRVVKDLNGLSVEAFAAELSARFDVTALPAGEAAEPRGHGEFCAFFGGRWYRCHVPADKIPDDVREGLEVQMLQRQLFAPVLGIVDPRRSPRIDFVGGIRGLGELERRCATDCQAAFALSPTGIDELFAVADANLLMPPKSTWFEPKLRSGLFIHKI